MIGFRARKVGRPIDPTTTEEVSLVIKDLQNRKAPGHYGISYKSIKNLPHVYYDHISILINMNSKFNHFPSLWKQATIVLIWN